MFCPECGLVADPGPLDARPTQVESESIAIKRQGHRPRNDAVCEEAPNDIKVNSDGFCIDAGIVAQGLGLEPGALHAMMKFGEITSVCEQGYGEDAGRHRLTLCHGKARMQLVVDSEGRILENVH